MKLIGIISKVNHPAAVELAIDIVEFLREKGIEVVCEDRMSGLIAKEICRPAQKLIEQTDLLVVVGGDGTMLHACRMVGDMEIPILGINMGRLGFLAEITPDEAFSTLEKALDGDIQIENRVRLAATVKRNGDVIARYHVLNDFVINIGRLARIIDLEVSIGDRTITKLRADGLIVGTPTGSTAYNMSAGGPIVYPSLGAILITPICPHTLTFRPILVSDTETVSIKVMGPEDALLTADGQVGNELLTGDEIIIKRAEKPCRLVVSSRGFFSILHSKLNWGDL
jgi:NAD+ kinase